LRAKLEAAPSHALARDRAMKTEKPFSVWANDRERPHTFATYAEAEAYAIMALRRWRRAY
jgi:hypothetical protein